MQAEFWLKRWRNHQIGFHRTAPLPFLVQHWPSLALPPASRVLVPLAGKSLDMVWLAGQGYRVLGVELSPLAVRDFLAEHDLHAETYRSTQGTHYSAGAIELIQGNVFDLDEATLETCTAIYDRAALIALPPPMRLTYARELYARLRPGCRGLLITLEYPQDEMEGPPFSVEETEVHTLFDADWLVERIERHNILDAQPEFAARGLTALHAAVYKLERRKARPEELMAGIS